MTYAATSNGLVIPMRKVTGAQAVAVRCIVRLASIRGEWVEDPTRGLYRIDTLALMSTSAIRQLVIGQLEQVRGVLDVVSATASVQSGALTIAAVVRTLADDGTTVDIDLADGTPYAARTVPAYLTILRYGASPHVLGGV